MLTRLVDLSGLVPTVTVMMGRGSAWRPISPPSATSW